MHLPKIIVANFKMNGTLAFFDNFLSQIPKSFSNRLILCPPFPYISWVSEGLRQREMDKVISMGAQDCSSFQEGAYTGNVSASMLRDLGCTYVILGHSERRHHHEESNELIREKAQKAHQAGLTPIICIGESLEERQRDLWEACLTKQLSQCLPSEAPYAVAYEPLWAIGTGVIPSLEETSQAHAFIKELLTDDSIPVLYGGSVKAENKSSILHLPLVDGVLVGGACLNPVEFNQIIS